MSRSHFRTPSALSRDMHTIAQDAEDLLDATRDVVDEKVKRARERLARTVDHSRGVCQSLEESAIEGARRAGAAVQEHPGRTACIVLGVGLLLGALIFRR